MMTLYDKLFLLALDEEKGNFLPLTKNTIAFGLAGAILAELALQGKLGVDDKQRLVVKDAAPTDDSILDEAMKEIEAAEKPRKLTFWISHFSEHPKKLRMKIGECLAVREVLLQDENRFHRRTSSDADAAAAVPSKFAIKHQLRGVILDGVEADSRSLAFLNIISATGLLGLVFTADELPPAKRIIHEKVIQQVLNDHLVQTVEEIEYAVLSSIEDSSE